MSKKKESKISIEKKDRVHISIGKKEECKHFNRKKKGDISAKNLMER